MVDTDASGLLAVLRITEDAKLQLGAGNGGELDSAVETLVLLGIIVLETNLELDGLGELAALLLGLLYDEGNAVAEGIGGKLAANEGRA